MSDYPERINISPVHRQKREDDFYLVDRAAFPGKGVEYTRTDHVQTLIAEAVAAEREACAELCDVVSMDGIGDIIRGIGDEIRARTYADARAALEARNKRLSDRRARDKQIRNEALREAVDCIGHITQSEDRDAILALIDADDKEP